MIIKKVKIDLEDIDLIENFIKEMNSFRSDIDARAGSVCVDAKSFLAIVALNKPEFDVSIVSSDPDEIRRFEEVMEKYK